MVDLNKIDVSALVFTDIDYEINEEDIESNNVESEEELLNTLPKTVCVKVPSQYRRRILKAIQNEELSSLEEVWDLFSEETGWCVSGATISTIDGEYTEQ